MTSSPSRVQSEDATKQTIGKPQNGPSRQRRRDWRAARRRRRDRRRPAIVERRRCIRRRTRAVVSAPMGRRRSSIAHRGTWPLCPLRGRHPLDFADPRCRRLPARIAQCLHSCRLSGVRGRRGAGRPADLPLSWLGIRRRREAGRTRSVETYRSGAAAAREPSGLRAGRADLCRSVADGVGVRRTTPRRSRPAPFPAGSPPAT